MSGSRVEARESPNDTLTLKKPIRVSLSGAIRLHERQDVLRYILNNLVTKKKNKFTARKPVPRYNLAAQTIQSQSLTQECLSSVYCAHGMRQEQGYGVFDLCVCSHPRHNTVRLLLKSRPGSGSSKDG